MNIYTISDVHIKPDGQNVDIMKKFLALPFEQNDSIYLLGDIFDLMIGPHNEYYKEYDWFFGRIKELLSQGIKVKYFEGNHDFHVEKLFQNVGVKVYKAPLKKSFHDKKILFCHGDEIEIGNPTYKKYKNFITSKPLNFIANKIMPYSLLNFIGVNASKKSRKRNKSRYGNPQENLKIRDSFRDAAEIASKEYGVEVVICGHSHYMDYFESDTLIYANNGYVPYTQSYIRISDKIEILKL
ncbi:UDP-2,3-diacylglucosamine diphosphatase [Bacteriovorax sp. Seq25_V]|uniref:UDP-2,3-diacylglucosamine diphosphatase n=1 Tax=Bacteriovorax sp. Seq25_V TaxID=1201288 RepID=UPI00041BE11E|nr:UDP-2,3-diacylglucosamine diphosphatase [Bacteriovorax sp. Seq25_V]